MAIELRKHGFSEPYLATMVRALKKLASETNIDSPSDVSLLIAGKKCSEAYKANLCDFYSHYCQHYGMPFVKPKYSRQHKLPNVPTEQEINLIISHASKKYALVYSILRDCGLRPIEVSNLRFRDVDLEKGTISVHSAKNGKPRLLRMKPSTVAMLKEYVGSHCFNLEDRLFPFAHRLSNTFERLRTSLANKLMNPRLRKIRLYDFRHYYATALYYDTKDILLVKESLGHRKIENTMVYTHLVRFECNDRFHCAVARTLQEACSLVEQGFEYVTEMDGAKIFRKRK